MELSDTQRAILTAAAEHPEHLAIPPERLPAGARQKVAQALLKNDLVIAMHRPACDAQAKWTVDGDAVLLEITDEGLRAIGVEPTAEEDEQNEAAIQRRNAERRAAAEAAPQDAPTAPTGGQEAAPQGQGAAAPEAAQEASQAAQEAAPAPRAPNTLRSAATALLAAWDDEANREADIIGALEGPIEALRRLVRALARDAARQHVNALRKPREGTQQQQVLAMLRRPEGATIAQIVDATGWQQHTVRGFFGHGEEAHGRLSSFGSQIRAWAELGDIHRAQALVPRMLAGSFSIYRDKDTQLDQWVLWFDRALRTVSAEVRPDIANFMAGIASAAAARRGYRPSETAEEAIIAVALAYSPAVADVYRSTFLEEGAFDFEAGIAAVCSAALRTPAAVPAACSVLVHLCLPYAELVRTALARDLGRAVGDLEDRALTTRCLAYIEDAIDIDLAPHLRVGWREGIAFGGRASRHADLFVHVESSGTVVAGLSSSQSDEHVSVTLRDGANLPAAEVIPPR